jgi:hypothetical protein
MLLKDRQFFILLDYHANFLDPEINFCKRNSELALMQELGAA